MVDSLQNALSAAVTVRVELTHVSQKQRVHEVAALLEVERRHFKQLRVKGKLRVA